jgi:hypothetical protein
MELLDMVPAHAIALRLYSLPAAAAAMGSICAWLVAALAAAVGLWRISAVGAFKTGAGVRSGSALVDDKKAQAVAPPPPAIDGPRPAARAEPADEPASPRLELSTPSKVRFTAYYGASACEDGVVDGVRNGANADYDGELETVVLRRTASAPAARRSKMTLAAAQWEESEMALRWRGDLGWYRHLDMAVLDGSVVRLWDDELTTSPWGRRRAGLQFQLSL